ncbi:MAG: hypothetical protein J5482_05745 [Oscillospiraceae bacterium]|nr:hypothetical protein [Oscillospiraceae bacterium]
MKVIGACTVLSGGLYFWLQFLSVQRRELALVRDLISALESLESAIRWKSIPVPAGLRELAEREISGKYFAAVADMVQSGFTLQQAWINAFSLLNGEMSAVMCRMEWSGDLQRIEGSLHYTAQELTRLFEARRQALRQKERLYAAMALSGAGLLIIVLI